MHLRICFGNQLFGLKKEDAGKFTIFLREDRGLCTYYRFHKHKLILFLAAMRAYAEEAKELGFDVHYENLSREKISYEKSLEKFIKSKNVKKVSFYEIEDKFFEKRIFDLIEKLGIEREVLQSPMFLSSRSGFQTYLKQQKKPFMKTFYERERKRLKILVDSKGKPEGGKWSFDEENRSALPAGMSIPKLPKLKKNKNVEEVKDLVQREFPDHPGDVKDFWIPVDREGAREWLDDFLKNRFKNFGPFEDAFSRNEDFLFHSVLTPFLNLGLLTPQEILQAALKYFRKNNVPIASAEGFVRQVMGWREFIRGIYQNFSEIQEERNFFGAKRKLSPLWYSGNTGIPPLDDVINKVNRIGYSHHIERLMVVGNLMTLLEISPKESHRWFMEMYVDSSDWVMGPNVFGMALFSDGGIFATKPYICGSNYYRKMGKFPKGEWCDEVDGLYWGFIERNRAFFLKNPRLSMMVRILDKMAKSRKEQLSLAAESVKKRLTVI
jgi:deoxyribodipyrimidine photolyase-related protein